MDVEVRRIKTNVETTISVFFETLDELDINVDEGE